SKQLPTGCKARSRQSAPSTSRSADEAPSTQRPPGGLLQMQPSPTFPDAGLTWPGLPRLLSPYTAPFDRRAAPARIQRKTYTQLLLSEYEKRFFKGLQTQKNRV